MNLSTVETPLFSSFFLGGFEASAHRLRSGKRLNLIAATEHDKHAASDYRRLGQLGITSVRDGICWPEIEWQAGRYDFSSALPLVRAARETGAQVIWDLCHYGWPDDLDVYGPQFAPRFAAFARAFTHLLVEEGFDTPFMAPINEMSFWAWGGGDVAYLNPFSHGRGMELKSNLVRAAIESIEAIWEVAPGARIAHIDPVMNVTFDPARPQDRGPAEGHHNAQFQSWDMLRGTAWPQLGGQEKYLDIIGINYYSNNQRIHNGPQIDRSHPLYRRFRHIVQEVYNRYQRPLFIAETGAEGDERAPWLRYIGAEARAAMRNGVPLEGICLYPILDYPGWDDDRYCPTGLLTYVGENGLRNVDQPLAAELRRQQAEVEQLQHSLQVEDEAA